MLTQEEKDRQTLQSYTQRFHVSYDDMGGTYYLTEKEKRYQGSSFDKLRGKPADPQFMERDFFERLNRWDQEERRQISLSGGYGGAMDIPASKWEEQRKRCEAEIQRGHELCKKYREEIYPKELQAYEDEFNALEEGRRQEQLDRVRRDDAMKSYFQIRQEKEKLRQQLEDPEWERLQMEIERKRLAIRRKAEAEVYGSQRNTFYDENQRSYEKERWMKMTMMNDPQAKTSADDLYQRVFGKKE